MRRSGWSQVKEPSLPEALNQTRRNASSVSAVGRSAAPSTLVMPPSEVSPNSTLNRPLVTLSATATFGSLPLLD